MKPHFIFLRIMIVFVIVLMVLTSCTSAEERLKDRFRTLPEIESTLIYEHSGVFSGASGRCSGAFLDRWFGTDLDGETVSKRYTDAFLEKGWTILPEDVVEIWSIEDDNGLYRTGQSVFADPTDISQERGSYRLPDSVVRELLDYPTVYVINMTYSYSFVVKRCS